jgi:hypothetical protein
VTNCFFIAKNCFNYAQMWKMRFQPAIFNGLIYLVTFARNDTRLHYFQRISRNVKNIFCWENNKEFLNLFPNNFLISVNF